MASEKTIRIYALSTCFHCKKAKRMLEGRSPSRTVIDVDLLDGEQKECVLAEVRKVNPRVSFPTILIGDTVIVGFREEEIVRALGS